MKALRFKELWLHILLTALLAAVFALWYANTEKRAPKNRPEGPPPIGELPPDRPMMPNKNRGPVKPENIILLSGILITVAANAGARSWLRREQQEKALQQLRNENLAGQLEALRYQINPHFFMNTLNNIHALVDIDPEKAKESIEEFSKMMRLVLYEGSAPTIPLEQELDYLNHYLSLMRLRYPESVKISTSFPEDCKGASIPPLVMASFVENAFKHGISYERESFVRVSVSLDEGKVIFKCVNSRHPGQTPAQHGIGMQNVRKRLDLQYGGNYTLNIEETPELYDILMILPL